MTGHPARLIARCPAKVNLSLRVLARRPDGYHELDSVFQAIDLWDSLELSPAERLTLACDDPHLAVDESNLVLRAARLLERRAGRPLTGAFRLRKRIPVGGGLGGGSSDAAGALLLGARFWRHEVVPTELEQMAAELGADVPFFLAGGTARGTGRGDRIETLPPLAETPLLLAIPPFGISTAEVFARAADRLTLLANGVSLPFAPWHKWQEEKDFGPLTNDLEAIVFDGWPELRVLRDALLQQGALAALLSGSGSTVFGTFGDTAGLERAHHQLRAKFASWRLVPTRSVQAGAHLPAASEAHDGRS